MSEISTSVTAFARSRANSIGHGTGYANAPSPSGCSLSMATQEESQPALLIVLTGADHWTLEDGTEHPTGFWAEELIEPMRVFRDAGRRPPSA